MSAMEDKNMETDSKRNVCCGFSSDRRYKTFALFFAFFALGCFIAIPGPTLIDLRFQVQTSVESITYIISGRSAGIIIGSILGGFVYDHMNHHLFLSILMMLTTVVTILIPFTRSLAALAACVAVQGIAMGSLDTGGNVLCLSLWGQENGPYMQSLHFAFGVGALMAPVIAEPLLSRRIVYNETALTILSTNSSLLLDENQTLSTQGMDIEIHLAKEVSDGNSENLPKFVNVTNKTMDMDTKESWTETQIVYAYISSAMLAVISAVLFMSTCIQERTCLSWKRQHITKVEEGPPTHEESMCFKGTFLVILAFFYFLYVGLEVSFGSLVTTFGFEILDLPKREAAHLSTVFWGTFAATRGISIIVSRFINSAVILIIDITLMVIAMLLLTLFINTHEIVVWLCTALYGIGMASVFPAGISWAERYIHITGKAASMFNIGSAFGELAFPPLFGHFFHVDGMYFVYVSLGGAIGNAVLFVLLVILARRQGERYISVSQKEDAKGHVETTDL